MGRTVVLACKETKEYVDIGKLAHGVYSLWSQSKYTNKAFDLFMNRNAGKKMEIISEDDVYGFLDVENLVDIEEPET